MVDVLGKMLEFLHIHGYSISEEEYLETLQRSVDRHQSLVFEGQEYSQSNLAMRRFFLGTTVFNKNPMAFLSIWAQMNDAEEIQSNLSTGELEEATTNSDSVAVEDPSDHLLKTDPEARLQHLDSQTLRDKLLQVLAIRGLDEPVEIGGVSYSSLMSEEAKSALEDYALENWNLRRELASQDSDLKQSMLAAESTLSLAQTALEDAEKTVSDLSSEGGLTASTRNIEAQLQSAIHATRLHLHANPKVSASDVPSMSAILADCKFPWMGHAVNHVISHENGGLKLAARLVRAINGIARPEQVDSDVNLADFLLEEDLQRWMGHTKKTYKFAGSSYPLELNAPNPGLLALLACRDEFELACWQESMEAGSSTWNLDLEQIESEKTALLSRLSEAMAHSAECRDSLTEAELDLADIATKLDKTKSRLSEIEVASSEIFQLSLHRISANYDLGLFEYLYETFSESLYAAIPAESDGIDVFPQYPDQLATFAVALVISALQFCDLRGQLCSDCVAVPCQCLTIEPEEKLFAHVERWHYIAPHDFLDLLDLYGDWCWGLFHIRPSDRPTYLIDLQSRNVRLLDEIVFRLRLGNLAKETWEVEDSVAALGKHGLPTYWQMFARLAKKNSGKVLPMPYAEQLVISAIETPNPFAFAQDNWHDFAVKYQHEKHHEAVSEFTEIPPWSNV